MTACTNPVNLLIVLILIGINININTINKIVANSAHKITCSRISANTI